MTSVNDVPTFPINLTNPKFTMNNRNADGEVGFAINRDALSKRFGAQKPYTFPPIWIYRFRKY